MYHVRQLVLWKGQSVGQINSPTSDNFLHQTISYIRQFPTSDNFCNLQVHSKFEQTYCPDTDQHLSVWLCGYVYNTRPRHWKTTTKVLEKQLLASAM